MRPLESTCREDIDELMFDGEPRTIDEMHAASGWDKKKIRSVIGERVKTKRAYVYDTRPGSFNPKVAINVYRYNDEWDADGKAERAAAAVSSALLSRTPLERAWAAAR